MHQLTTGTQTIEAVSASPDGESVAYDSNVNGNSDIYKLPVEGGEPEQLTHNGSDNFFPVWSPDGKRIAYHSLVNGNRDVFVMDANGRNVVQVTNGKREELAGIWLNNGNSLGFQVYPDSLFVTDKTGSGWSKPRFITRATFAFSDGNRLMTANDNGQVCATCPGGAYVWEGGISNPKYLKPAEMLKVLAYPGGAGWGPNADLVFAIGEKDGSTSVWRAPIDGKKEERIAHLTDPLRQIFRSFNLGVDAKNLYLVIGDTQSDIWTMELKKQ
jgi:hypothetical protein